MIALPSSFGSPRRPASCRPSCSRCQLAEARSLAAEWALVNEQADAGKLTATYVDTMHKWLREGLRTDASSLTQPNSSYGREIKALLAEPDGAARDARNRVLDRVLLAGVIPRDECERVRRRPVEPLHVVDRQQHGAGAVRTLLDQALAKRGALLAVGVKAGAPWQTTLGPDVEGMTLGIIQYVLGGKNLGDDLAEGKATLPLIHAMAKADPATRERLAQIVSACDTTAMPEVLAAIRDSGGMRGLQHGVRNAWVDLIAVDAVRTALRVHLEDRVVAVEGALPGQLDERAERKQVTSDARHTTPPPGASVPHSGHRSGLARRS